MVADANSDKRTLYVCYNRDLADEARRKFPAHVDCRTLHSIAFQEVGRRYRHKLGNPRVRTLMQQMGSTNYMVVAQGWRTLQTYLNSGSDSIGIEHVSPDVTGSMHLRESIIKMANRIFQQMQDVNSDVPMPHDGYLKLWSQESMTSGRALDYDVVLLDEAQDSNPITLGMAMRQRKTGRSGVLLVGDRHQSIYGWRNAVNAMELFGKDADLRGALTSCFRFGQSTADMASRVLNEWKDDPVRLTGAGQSPQRIASRAVVARTNSGLIAQAFDLLDVGERFHFSATEATRGDPHVPYGFDEIMDMYHLFMGNDAKIRQGSAASQMRDWDEAEEIASDEVKASLEPEIASAVRMVKRHSAKTPVVLRAVSNESIASHRANAGICMTTAHRSKGREWDQVEVCDGGFAPIHDTVAMDELRGHNGQFSTAVSQEINLIYVALTRSRAAPLLGNLLGHYFEGAKVSASF